jgi:hypothetical protein
MVNCLYMKFLISHLLCILFIFTACNKHSNHLFDSFPKLKSINGKKESIFLEYLGRDYKRECSIYNYSKNIFNFNFKLTEIIEELQNLRILLKLENKLTTKAQDYISNEITVLKGIVDHANWCDIKKFIRLAEALLPTHLRSLFVLLSSKAC